MKALITYLNENNNNPGNELSIFQAIQKLPIDNKMAIEMHFLNGVSRQQIATELNWSISKVNQKITRGITLLKQQLNPEYFREADQIMKQTAQRLLSR